MSLWRLVVCSIPLLLTGCFKGQGDVLMLSDGNIIQGELESIGSGAANFNTGSSEIPLSGRVWLLNGDTFSGEVSLSDGTVRAGGRQAPADSILVIVWGDTEIRSASFSVNASEGWLDTGIELEPGTILALTADGLVVTETGTSTPDGQNEFSSSVAIAPGATSGQLVFKTGENGSPVAAGSSWAGELYESGSLRLAVNVPSEGSIRTGGTYSVHVTAGSSRGQAGLTVFYPAAQ